MPIHLVLLSRSAAAAAQLAYQGANRPTRHVGEGLLGPPYLTRTRSESLDAVRIA
jgi:hypothetical protein